MTSSQFDAGTRLTVIVNVHAKIDRIDFMKDKLLSLIDYTRAEEGCIVFDLHQNNENPAHFFFYEIWQTRDLWLTHMATPSFEKYKASIADAIDDIGFHEMTQLA